MIDLDAAEYNARHHPRAKWVQPTVLGLVAESRAAREVVEAGRKLRRTTKGNAAALQEAAYIEFDAAVDAYDEVTRP